MKYFTNELWNLINSENLNERTMAKAEWKANSEEYSNRYKQLVGRLPSRVYKFFSSNDFHDYQVTDVKITQDAYGVSYPVSVDIIVKSADDKWNIAYKKVTKLSLNFLIGGSPYEIKRGFDDWGYDEFLIVDNKTLSHEILFASGAVILIHFYDKNISIKKVNEL